MMSFWRRLSRRILPRAQPHDAIPTQPDPFPALSTPEPKPESNTNIKKTGRLSPVPVPAHAIEDLPRIVNPRLGLECRLRKEADGYFSTLWDEINDQAIDRSTQFYSDLRSAIVASMRRVGIRDAEIDPPELNDLEKLGVRLRSLKAEQEHDPKLDSQSRANIRNNSEHQQSA